MLWYWWSYVLATIGSFLVLGTEHQAQELKPKDFRPKNYNIGSCTLEADKDLSILLSICRSYLVPPWSFAIQTFIAVSP